MRGTPAWFPTNVARNSPPHYSNFEMRPLQFQRFRGTSKTDQGKLRATFRGGPVAPGRRGRGWPGGYAHSRGPGTPGHDPFTRELPVRAPSVGGLRPPQPIHTGAPGSRSQRRRIAASMTPSHGGLPNGSPHQRDSNTTSVRQPLRLLREDGGSRVDGLAARQRLTNPRPFSAQS